MVKATLITAVALGVFGGAVPAASETLVLECPPSQTEDLVVLCQTIEDELQHLGFEVLSQGQKPGQGQRLHLLAEQVSARAIRAQLRLDGPPAILTEELTLSVIDRAGIKQKRIKAFATTLVGLTGLSAR